MPKEPEPGEVLGKGSGQELATLLFASLARSEPLLGSPAELFGTKNLLATRWGPRPRGIFLSNDSQRPSADRHRARPSSASLPWKGSLPLRKEADPDRD